MSKQRSRAPGSVDREPAGLLEPDVCTFLVRYGYLERSGGGSGHSSTQGFREPDVEKALRVYQQRNALPATGVLDDVTVERMSAPRCGNHDLLNARADERVWFHSTVSYAITEPSHSISSDMVDDAIEEAFRLWADASPFTFEKRELHEEPDIWIGFETGSHGDGFPFGGRDGDLAHSLIPATTVTQPARIHFDDARDWTIDLPVPDGKFDLVTVAAHEIGHCLGLEHSSVEGALMFPCYRGQRRTVTGEDAQRVRGLYDFSS
ncbi:MAG: matrixin family metalloprotease [Myxococcota bacterium]